MCVFENKVFEAFNSLNIKITSEIRIGVAVSGGADSVSLLVSLAEILKNSNCGLFVVTVNHNLREKEETDGDADYVRQLCEELQSYGYNITFSKYEIERGKIKSLCDFRKSGMEECARFLRYEIFNAFIKENNLDYLCLAHNKNDQLETVLMRFLQGGSLEALGGIKEKRDKFIRPLLNISRYEIEQYLRDKNIPWRTDSTNLETEYLRNKIRLELIPVLNQSFQGWDKSVLRALKYYSEDAACINRGLEQFKINENNGEVTFSLNDFFTQSKSIQIRILLKSFNLAGEDKRIPVEFLEDVINSFNCKNGKSYFKAFGTVEIFVKKDVVFIKKADKKHTELVFFDIIEESGQYLFPFGEFKVVKTEKQMIFSVNNSVVDVDVDFPIIVRSAKTDDEVEMADGNMKRLADVYSDWHVSEDNRHMIPVVQSLCDENQSICCVIGSFLGYKDWIIKK